MANSSDLRCAQFTAAGLKKNPPASPAGFRNKSLAVPYFRVGSPHTIIGAEQFHFRVRNGIGWFPLAIAARQTCHDFPVEY